MDGLTVAVTGANGFLGGAIARNAAQRGAVVRSLVRRPDDAVGNVFLGDLEAGGWERAAFEGADVVIHCAAALGGPIDHQRRINVDGSRSVAEEATAAGVSRFVHVSSIAVYGYRADTFSEDREPTPSRQAYSITKTEAEVAVRSIIPGAAIIRPGGIFGPGARFWSANFARRAKRLLPLNIGRGTGTLPVVFVEDAADLAVTLADHPAAVGEVFNCVLDPSPTWREYQAAYGRLVGRDGWIALPGFLARGVATTVSLFGRRHSNLESVAELLSYSLREKRFPMDKARNTLGWQPRYDLDAGVAATAEWLRENRHI